MGFCYAVLHRALSISLIFGVLLSVCSARESLWGIKLTQVSECATPNYVHTGVHWITCRLVGCVVQLPKHFHDRATVAGIIMLLDVDVE